MSAASPSSFVAACVQMRSGVDPRANIDAAVTMIREAAAAGATYVQTPEMSNVVNRSRAGLFAMLAGALATLLVDAGHRQPRDQGLVTG